MATAKSWRIRVMLSIWLLLVLVPGSTTVLGQEVTTTPSPPASGPPSGGPRSSTLRPDRQAPTPLPTTTPSTASRPGTRSATVRRGNRDFQTTVFDAASAPDGHAMRAGSLVVQYKDGAPVATRSAAHAQFGAVAVEKLALPNLERIQVAPEALARTMAAYQARADVASVEPDYLFRPASTPNDALFNGQYNLRLIEASAAWDVTRSDPSIRIAILDCGIYGSSSQFRSPDGLPGHPDVRSKIVGEVDFTGSPYGADDFCDQGTAVAGLAAAVTNNGRGIAGVAPNATLLNVKVLDDDGIGSVSTIVNGIVWARQNGAKVMNLGFFGEGPCPAAMQAAIDAAWNAGIVLVAAGGELDGPNDQSRRLAPSNCRRVIGTGVVTPEDSRLIGTNFGQDIDIAAPGDRVLVTDFEGNYPMFTGSSMAAAHVSGVAALLLSTSHYASNRAAVDRLLQTADNSHWTHSSFRTGRLNARKAVQPPVSVASCPSPRPAVRLGHTRVNATDVEVVVTAGAGGVREIRYGTLRGGAIDSLEANLENVGGFTSHFSGAPQARFRTRATNDAQTVTVPLTVVDDCGEWKTFFGGGSGTFRSATVRGKIKDLITTFEVEGAAVRVEGTESPTITDQWGNFQVFAPFGRQTIVVSKDGYATERHVLNITSAFHENISISLHPPAGTITGLVRHALTKEPLPLARVGVGRWRATTGNDGRFTLENAPAGSGTLVAEKSDYEPASAPYSLAVGQTLDVMFELTPSPESIFVRVQNAMTLAPIGGATIQVQGTGISETTNSLGWRVVEIPVGQQTVVTSAPGYITDTQVITVVHQAPAPLTINLSPSP